MPQYIFQTIAKKGVKAGVQQMKPADAVKWFRSAATAVSTANPNKMIGSADNFELVHGLSFNSIGKMYLFNYQAKGDGTPHLPYWDKYPCIFPIEFYPQKASFLGINLHYLPPYARSKLMDALYKTMNNQKLNKTTKLKISYGILKSAAEFRYFKPCVKKYLVSHVKSSFLYAKPGLWDMFCLLPMARFKGAAQTRVWSESMTKL